MLCEKPATLTFEENAEIAKIARENNTFFMEAMKTRFIPLIFDIKNLIKEGTIGEVTRVETCFAYRAPRQLIERSTAWKDQPVHYLIDKEQGGALNDTGSYCIASILDYIHSPVKSIKAAARYEYGVDANDRISAE